MENDEQGAGRLAPSEFAQRLEQAGEYKGVNTLLHDLHAEQRHRMLFSSSVHPSQLPMGDHHPRQHPESEHSYPLPSHIFPPSPSAHGPSPVAPQDPQTRMASFVISIPSKETSEVDHVEVQRVTERYEDTNRYILQH